MTRNCVSCDCCGKDELQDYRHVTLNITSPPKYDRVPDGVAISPGPAYSLERDLCPQCHADTIEKLTRRAEHPIIDV